MKRLRKKVRIYNHFEYCVHFCLTIKWNVGRVMRWVSSFFYCIIYRSTHSNNNNLKKYKKKQQTFLLLIFINLWMGVHFRMNQNERKKEILGSEQWCHELNCYTTICITEKQLFLHIERQITEFLSFLLFHFHFHFCMGYLVPIHIYHTSFNSIKYFCYLAHKWVPSEEYITNIVVYNRKWFQCITDSTLYVYLGFSF